MLIERVFPGVVGAKATLEERLAAEGLSSALAREEIDELISTLPIKILNSDCFFDNLTKGWRYEYGAPRRIAGNQLLWGTHMWPPVTILLRVLRAAHHRLSDAQRRRYFGRLADIEKHEDVLSEFLPILRLPDEVLTDFEHPTGSGGRDVEWRIRATGQPPILVEVKHRMRDLLEVADRMGAGDRDPDGTAPAPTHDVGIIFRGVEDKFLATDPEQQLQGVWVSTELQQEHSELAAAFTSLDPTKIHYAILGTWEPGITVLTRRASDRTTLLEVFREQDTGRFTFHRKRG